MLSPVLLFIRKYISYAIPGIIVFFLLFVISMFMNLALTYMGNTSSAIADIIIRQFMGTIIWQIIKSLLVFLAIGSFFSIIFFRAITELSRRFLFFSRTFNISVLTCISLFVLALFIFFRKLIITPQLYMDNFASKGIIFTRFQHFLTDNIHPVFFTVFIYIIIVSALILCILSFNWSRFYNAIRTKINSVKYLRITAALLLFSGIVLILYKQKVIFYTESNLPNIIIISADALRPDHMSCNGYKRNTTPNIDRLAGESLQIRGTITTVPRTFPSWVSILTSQYPLTHDIKHMFPRTRERNKTFNSACNCLNDKGYETSLVSDFAGDIFPRIELGFDSIQAPNMNPAVIIKLIILEKQTFLLPFITNEFGMFFFPEIRDMARFSIPETITAETIDRIDSARGKPFFITAFYSITHFPFAAPYPYYKKYSDPDYNGPFKYCKDRIVNFDSRDNPEYTISKEDVDQVNSLYDGCMDLFDRETGRILDHLKRNDLLDNTIVVITADHGENLYEKEFGMGHGEHLRGDYSLEVPFFIYSGRLEKFRGRTVKGTSSIIDIMPSIFETAGFKFPGFFNGTSIIGRIKGDEYLPLSDGVDAYCETGLWFENDKKSRLFFHHLRIDYPDITEIAEIDFTYKDEMVIKQKYQNPANTAKHRVIYCGRYKLIYVPLADGPVFELYDRVSDPDNEHDLSAARKDILNKMKDKFYRFADEKSSGNFIEKKGLLIPAFSDPVF